MKHLWISSPTSRCTSGSCWSQASVQSFKSSSSEESFLALNSCFQCVDWKQRYINNGASYSSGLKEIRFSVYSSSNCNVSYSQSTTSSRRNIHFPEPHFPPLYCLYSYWKCQTWTSNSNWISDFGKRERFSNSGLTDGFILVKNVICRNGRLGLNINGP